MTSWFFPVMFILCIAEVIYLYYSYQHERDEDGD